MLDELLFIWGSSAAPYVAVPNRNLTYLANVRQWVGSSTDVNNALLSRLIVQASRLILNYLQRPDIGLTSITETISGRGERKIQLRNWPVISVSDLTVNAISIPASTGPTNYGYFLEPVYGGLAGRAQNLGIVGGMNLGAGVGLSNGYVGFSTESVWGRGFPRGTGNIAVNYSYGYCIQNEVQTIPYSPYEVIPYAPYGSWMQDNGVSYQGGSRLTAVSGNPSTGQYVPPNLTGDNPTLYYQFSSGDADAVVLLNYNYVPADIEQACIETVGERYRYKSRIGLKSETLGGQETASYDLTGLTMAVLEMLEPYRLVAGP